MRNGDADAFRARQRGQWDGAATGWRAWSQVIDEAASGVSRRLVEMAGVDRGSRVLDVAAGYGEPALTAARLVGATGFVVATDISAGMVAYGRERCVRANLTNVEFVVSDAASLDFPQGSFDAALSRWGIIFEPEAEVALGRIRRFLNPGARMAISSWGPPERVPFVTIPISTAVRHLNVAPPPPRMPGPLARPSSEALAGLLEAGGFSAVDVEGADVTFRWRSVDEFVAFLKDTAPPLTALIEPHPQEIQDETWKAIADAVAELAGEAETLTLTNHVLLAAGVA